MRLNEVKQVNLGENYGSRILPVGEIDLVREGEARISSGDGYLCFSLPFITLDDEIYHAEPFFIISMGKEDNRAQQGIVQFLMATDMLEEFMKQMPDADLLDEATLHKISQMTENKKVTANVEHYQKKSDGSTKATIRSFTKFNGVSVPAGGPTATPQPVA